MNFDLPEYLYGATGLGITLEKMIIWAQKLNQNVLLKDSTKKQMLKEFTYTHEPKHFASGWEILNDDHYAYGFSGGGVVQYLHFSHESLSIIWFTNGYQYNYDIKAHVRYLAGLVLPKLMKKQIFLNETIEANFLNKNLTEAIEIYSNLKTQHDDLNFMPLINRIGYRFIHLDRNDDAIRLFKMNTIDNPHCANCFDSLAEAYFTQGKLELAKRYYQKTLELDPQSVHAEKMLDKIQKSE